jgi:hypothetical protein
MLAVLGAFEAALRIFLPQKLYRFPSGLFESDPVRVYRLRPGFRGSLENPEYSTHVAINSLGMRGGPVDAGSTDRFRILALGDSFTSAFNVEEEETFLSVALGAAGPVPDGRSLEVLNAGVPGYGTWHQLRAFRELAPTLRPDAALLAVYVGNDLEENLDPFAIEVRDGYLVHRRASRGILPARARAWLQRHSMTYVLVWRGWDRIRPLIGKRATDPIAPLRSLLLDPAPARVEKGYAASGSLLREFRAESDRLRVPLLVVLIPAELQIYPERFRAELERNAPEGAALDFDLPSRRWERLARETGLPVLDLLPVLRERAGLGPYLYMSLDGHLSREGNRVAGEAIGDAIVRWIGRAAREAA